jgi:hypothetical protein
LQTGKEIVRDGRLTTHNENLYSLNDHSAAEDGYAGDLDLSEWLKLDDWKQ